MNIITTVVLTAFSAFLATSVAAQTASTTTERTGSPTPAARATGQQQQMYRGSKIIGANLRDTKDNKIGEIKDLMLDSARGEIAYAVVSFDGVTGSGRRYHAIPWQVLQPAESGRYYVLNADRETLSQAPGFDRKNWPDMADQKWSADVDRYWTRMVGRGLPDNSLSSGGSAAGAAQQGPGAGPKEESGRDGAR